MRMLHLSIVCLAFFISSYSAFLFDSSTPAQNVGSSVISNKEYHELLDLIIEERGYRRQIEQYIKGQLHHDLMTLTNATIDLNNIYINLRDENIRLKNELASLLGETSSKDKLTQLEHDLNLSVQRAVQQNGNLQNKVTALAASLNDSVSQVETRIQNLTEEVEGANEIVSLQACGGQPLNDHSPGYFREIRMTYPDIQEVHGFKNLTSLKTDGTFVCERPGQYLFIFSIAGKISNRRYQIVMRDADRKFTILSSVQVAPYYTHSSSIDMVHTGTAAAVAQLNVNDTIYLDIEPLIAMRTPYSLNCVTIVKLK